MEHQFQLLFKNYGKKIKSKIKVKNTLKFLQNVQQKHEIHQILLQLV